MKKNDINFFVEYAIKAPSGHNTQPWKFEQTENGITIHPDFTRTLPVVDSDNHALYISLGCALENIIIAAHHKGCQCTVQYPTSARSGITVQIRKDEPVNIQTDDLFDFITARQVNRSKYSDREVPAQDLKILNSCFNFDGISLLLLNGKKKFEKIIPFVIEGNNLQFGNRKFINELTGWFRYSKNEAERKKDGLWIATMGLPNMGRLIGNFVMKNFVSAKSEGKRIRELLLHTQGLAIFIADENNPTSWVKIGRAFQRFGLTATKLGICHAHLNMPCEEVEVRRKLAKELNIENKHPLLLIRYGYAEKMPYSYRRPISDVIINQ